MTGATAANAQALNAAAKEFVPHCDDAATLRKAPSTEQPKKDAAQAQSHLHHLRVNAPAFVPRASGHHPATPDRPSERPAQSSSSIAASVSGSSTSGASRTADCCAPEEGDDEEGEAGVGACGESSAGGCCECGAEDGECGHSSNAGEEGDALAGGGAYGGGALEQLPYRWEGGVPYNGAVYYDAAFVDPYGLATYGYLTDGSFEATPRPGAQASSINPAKPNFAAMLRNSVSADVNLAAPASKPAAGKSAVGGAKQTQPAAAPKGSAPAAEGVAVPRVATGAAAAAQYGEERAEAAVLARARNAFFMQQQGGGKRQAGGKTEQQGKGGGKAHPAQPQGTGGKAQGVPSEGCVRFVDLHGLHVTEAVAALEAQIEAARAAGCSHLRGAKTPARLPAAVADTLLAHHITFRTLQPGLLEGSL
eukprot:XP_001702797.1 predicted protein [Chlamydomonas reinhardtii]